MRVRLHGYHESVSTRYTASSFFKTLSIGCSRVKGVLHQHGLTGDAFRVEVNLDLDTANLPYSTRGQEHFFARAEPEHSETRICNLSQQ